MFIFSHTNPFVREKGEVGRLEDALQLYKYIDL